MHPHLHDERAGRGVLVPPPPAPHESVPAPRQGYAWIPGYWDWVNDRHVWAAGHWIPARHGCHWRRHRWILRGERWHLEAGGWVLDEHGTASARVAGTQKSRTP